jgi:hypothetical protein
MIKASEKLLRKYMGEFTRSFKVENLPRDLIQNYNIIIDVLQKESTSYDYVNYIRILTIFCSYGLHIPDKIHKLILITGTPPCLQFDPIPKNNTK